MAGGAGVVAVGGQQGGRVLFAVGAGHVVGAGDDEVFTIRRTLMPPGTSLHFVIFQEHGADGVQHVVRTGLVEGEPRPCRLLGTTGK